MNSPKQKCEWSQCEGAEKAYSTECGRMFEFTNDGPIENRFAYCPYCGGILVNLIDLSKPSKKRRKNENAI